MPWMQFNGIHLSVPIDIYQRIQLLPGIEQMSIRRPDHICATEEKKILPKRLDSS